MSTDIADTAVEPPLEGATRRRRLPPVRRFAGVLMIGCAVGLVVLLLTGGNSDTASAQLREVRQACTQWLAQAPDQPAPPASWCTNMTNWMADRLNDHPGMMATPAALQATCQQWSFAHPGDLSEGQRIPWCDDMVTWMQQNAQQWGSWNGWIMHGPMMR